jgi:curved DNA-binding protein CbpA
MNFGMNPENWVRALDGHTAYEVLGVKRTATDEEIKTAHLRLIKDYHPDVNPKDVIRARRANVARDVLLKHRASYDRWLRDNITSTGQCSAGNGRDRSGAHQGSSPGAGRASTAAGSSSRGQESTKTGSTGSHSASASGTGRSNNSAGGRGSADSGGNSSNSASENDSSNYAILSRSGATQRCGLFELANISGSLSVTRLGATTSQRILQYSWDRLGRDHWVQLEDVDGTRLALAVRSVGIVCEVRWGEALFNLTLPSVEPLNTVKWVFPPVPGHLYEHPEGGLQVQLLHNSWPPSMVLSVRVPGMPTPLQYPIDARVKKNKLNNLLLPNRTALPARFSIKGKMLLIHWVPLSEYVRSQVGTSPSKAKQGPEIGPALVGLAAAAGAAIWHRRQSRKVGEADNSASAPAGDAKSGGPSASPSSSESSDATSGTSRSASGNGTPTKPSAVRDFLAEILREISEASSETNTKDPSGKSGKTQKTQRSHSTDSHGESRREAAPKPKPNTQAGRPGQAPNSGVRGTTSSSAYAKATSVKGMLSDFLQQVAEAAEEARRDAASSGSTPRQEKQDESRSKQGEGSSRASGDSAGPTGAGNERGPSPLDDLCAAAGEAIAAGETTRYRDLLMQVRGRYMREENKAKHWTPRVAAALFALAELLQASEPERAYDLYAESGKIYGHLEAVARDRGLRDLVSDLTALRLVSVSRASQCIGAPADSRDGAARPPGDEAMRKLQEEMIRKLDRERGGIFTDWTNHLRGI